MTAAGNDPINIGKPISTWPVTMTVIPTAAITAPKPASRQLQTKILVVMWTPCINQYFEYPCNSIFEVPSKPLIYTYQITKPSNYKYYFGFNGSDPSVVISSLTYQFRGK
jgi:hypothetical protein